MRSTAGFAFLDRAGERATDLLSHSRADKRLAEIGTKRSTAEHEQKHGVEQSTASSRAVSKQHVRTRSGSSCNSHLQLNPQNFGLRRCDLAPEAPISRGAQGAPKKWSYRWPLQATSSTLLLVRCKGVDVDVGYANIGNSYSIMRRFTRH